MINVSNPYNKPSTVTKQSPIEVKKDSPGVPPNSCPYIDQVITCIQDIHNAYDDLYTKDIVTPMMDDTYELSKTLLEHIRRMNENLRDNSKYWYDRYKENLPKSKKKR